MDGSGIRIRVDNQLREAFVEACRKQDQTASQVLRAYMRQFVGEQEDGLQQDLFSPRDAEET